MENYEYKNVHLPANHRKQARELNKHAAQGWELVGPVRLVLGAGTATAHLRRPKAHVQAEPPAFLVRFIQRATAAIERSNARMEKRIAEQGRVQAERTAVRRAIRAARKTGKRA